MRKISYVFLIFYLVSYKTFSVDFENSVFQHISTEHGLSQKTVQAILQDDVGFLWLGTQEGLNRYDGRDIRVFRHSATDNLSISHDVIRDLAQDSDGSLWVATSGGLNRYDAAKENFWRVTLERSPGEFITRLNTLYIDSKNVVWVGTENGGLFYSEGRGDDLEFKAYSQVEALVDTDVRSIFEDSRGRMWVGTNGKGAFLIQDEKVQHFLPSAENNSALSHNQIRSIYEDSKGRLWIGTRGGGLNKFIELTKEFKHYRANSTSTDSLNHDRVYQVYEDSHGNLWIATDNVLAVYQAENDSFVQIKHNTSLRTSLSHDRVLSIFEDRGGMLWFGTLSGLNQWNPYTAGFEHFRKIAGRELSLNNNTIYAFTEKEDGDILIGTFGGGLNVLNVKENFIKPVLQNGSTEISIKRVMSLMIDNKNNLWIGSISNGIEVLSSSLKKIHEFRHQSDDATSLSANGVTSILQDNEGDIWVSTYRAGLNLYDKENNRFKRIPRKNGTLDARVNEKIFHIMEDDEGYIWLSSDGGGISKFDKKQMKFKHFLPEKDNPNSLSGSDVFSMFQDSKGRFWIGTQGNGLNRWEPEDRRREIERFRHYSVQNGLNSSTVYGVLEDKDGIIWISTTRGLNKLDPDTNKITHFNLADELHYNELNQGAMLRARNGHLFFGGINGISAFHPDDISKNPNQPKVVITNISSLNKRLLFEKSLSNLNEVTFDHNDYLVSFEFAALDFAQPKKNRYQYKLDGFDSEWIENGTLNRAIFTNLPSGTYTLKVKGSNNDGVWSEESVNLRVNVLPAPWFSWWAYSLYGIVFCIIIILMIRSQAKRIANQEMFQAQVSDKVSEKTELYLKNNNFLKEQLESVKNISNVDVETGLPNQKYFTDLISANVGWVKRVQLDSKDTSWRMVLGYIRIQSQRNKENFERDFNRVAKALAQDSVKYKHRKIVRWGSREIGILDYFNNDDVDFDAGEWKKAVTAAAEKNGIENLDISTAYCISPLGGIKDHFLNGNDMMMLTEHLLHLVEIEHGHNVVGLEKLNQPLNNVIFKQILEADRLSELSEIFTLKLE